MRQEIIRSEGHSNSFIIVKTDNLEGNNLAIVKTINEIRLINKKIKKNNFNEKLKIILLISQI